MEDLLRPIYQKRASNENTLGILLAEKKDLDTQNVDFFDGTLVIFVKKLDQCKHVKHYEIHSNTTALYIVDEKQLNDWLVHGTYRDLFNWVLNGKILFERNDYVTDLREQLYEFPLELRNKKKGLEFAKLIKTFIDGKSLYEAKQYLDSYNQMVQALHHLGRFCVIEHGIHPEVTVWNQVKDIEPEVFKLYEELVTGSESVGKRIELILIATGFAISARTKSGSKHLLNVMKFKQEVWSYSELLQEAELQDYGMDLQCLLQHLIKKEIVCVQTEESKGLQVYHRKYTVIS